MSVLYLKYLCEYLANPLIMSIFTILKETNIANN